MQVKLNQRGAAAFEEILLGTMLTLACVGSFVGMTSAVKGVMGMAYKEYNSYGLGTGCSERTCSDFTPNLSPPTSNGIPAFVGTGGLGEPPGGP